MNRPANKHLKSLPNTLFVHEAPRESFSQDQTKCKKRVLHHVAAALFRRSCWWFNFI
ncbi:hypothetical protein HMPREF0880_00490 [Yokenella regensburgei ATCC 43003]|nr:hypothetical protein HMPREF0880_00490 [Yokenella regensburgei ATCC 43003]